MSIRRIHSNCSGLHLAYDMTLGEFLNVYSKIVFFLYFSVSEAYQCYECERYEVFDVAGGRFLDLRSVLFFSVLLHFYLIHFY